MIIEVKTTLSAVDYANVYESDVVLLMKAVKEKLITDFPHFLSTSMSSTSFQLFVDHYYDYIEVMFEVDSNITEDDLLAKGYTALVEYSL